MVSLVTAIIGLAMAALILVLIRKDRMHVHHGLGWVLVALSFALLGLSPGIIDRLAHFRGGGYPPVLALMLGFSLMVIKILLMDIERSRLETRNQRLIQRVAMLEADMKKLNEIECKMTAPEQDS